MDEKRRRGKHFTPQECSLLITLVGESIHIIENKKTDVVSVSQKNKAWDELSKKFNISSDNEPQSTLQLRNYYDNCERKTRKDNADDKGELYKTGGGKFVKKLDEDGERLRSLIRPRFQPDKNVFDSATAYHDISAKQDLTQIADIASDTSNDVADSMNSRSADTPVRMNSASSLPSSSNARNEAHQRPKSAKYRPQQFCGRRDKRSTPNTVYERLIKLTSEKSEKIQMQSTYEKKKLELLKIEKKVEEDVCKHNAELTELAKVKLNLEIEGLRNVQKHENELFELRKKKYMTEIRVQENNLESQMDKLKSTHQGI